MQDLTNGELKDIGKFLREDFNELPKFELGRFGLN